MTEDELRSIFTVCLGAYPDVLEADLSIDMSIYPSFFKRFKHLCDKKLANGDTLPVSFADPIVTEFVTTANAKQRVLIQAAINNLVNEYRADQGGRKVPASDPRSNMEGEKDGHWRAALRAEQVPESLQAGLINKFRIEVARAIRPKWADRLDYPELRTLTAPAFLKKVHAAEIGKDGSVSSDVIRAIDDRLIQAVELYVGQRKRVNGGDMGDAVGLRLVHKRRSASQDKVPSPL